MMIRIATAALWVTASLAGSMALAAAPEFIPVQGRLSNETDVPLDNVTVAVRFSLHTAAQAGTELWYESQSITPRAGLFTAYLGQVRPLDLILFRDQASVWMEIRVGTDEPMPRVMLGSAPFAGYAQFCGAHTHSFADLTGTAALPASALPASTVTGPQACTGTDKVSGISETGRVQCTTDVAAVAGGGISAQSCPGTQKVAGINASGLIQCLPDEAAPAGSVVGPQTCIGTDKVSGISQTGQIQCTSVVNAAQVQTRLSVKCTGGDFVKSVDPDTGEVACETPTVAPAPSVPAGVIVMWSGALASIPTGWALCDGQNGTPDLRDRFVLGTSASEAPGASGGAHSYSLTVGQLPAHAHTGTTNERGSHTHQTGIKYATWGGSGGLYHHTDGAMAESIPIEAAGEHTHTVTTNSIGSGSAIDNRPAFYKLAFIMKL